MSSPRLPASPAEPKKGITYSQADDFRGYYANNSQVLSSNWDLKLLFGELEQALGPNQVVQHCSVTLSWATAKVLCYFLQMHLAGHELDFGRIVIGKDIIPEFPPHPPKDATDKEKAEKLFKVLRKIYDDFKAANSEIAP